MATYTEKFNLSKDAVFLGRVTIAVAKFADYIMSEPETTENHRARVRWAQNAALNPQTVAVSIATIVTWNADVDYGLADVLDEALQTAVEVACGKFLFT